MMAHGRASEYLDGALDASEEAAFLEHLPGCEACQSELHEEVQLRDREDDLRGATAADALHDRVHDYLDGALDRDTEAAFLDHVARCRACQRALHEEVQLRDREDSLRKEVAVAPPRPAPMPAIAEPRPLRRPRLSLRPAWVGAVAGALCAALALLWLWPPASPALLTTRPTRVHEIRTSYARAAQYRPYDTMLGSAAPGEPVEPAVIAELDRAGDCQGVATAYMLSGELVRADERYRRCPPGIDIDADRAGLAVLRHELDAALDLTETVLDVAPDHTVALWNRALALHGLGLDLAAAAAFDRVATLDAVRAPGWAREAADRARVMRAEIEQMRTVYANVDRLGLDMARGGPPLAIDLAQQVPWRSRLHLHDAIRTATTTARLDELAPLAAALDSRTGGDVGRYLTAARAQLSPDRIAAAARYQEILAQPDAVDDRAWDRWLALATRAHADDLILGARILTQRLDGEPSAEQLAAATHDPWFELGVGLARGRAALNAGHIEAAAASLTALQDRCPAGRATYRCLQLAIELARLANDRDQPSEAKRQALAALALSRQLGEWPQRGQALVFAAEAGRFGGEFGEARAYYEESGHSLDACGVRNTAFTTAEMLFQRHHLPQARAVAAAAPACDQVPDPNELTVLVRLLRAGHPVVDRASVAARIAEAQRRPSFAGDAPYLDYLAAWLVLDDEPAAREQLARVADRAREVEAAMRDKTLAAIDNALFSDAGRRRAWSDALAIAARAHGVAPPARCALAFGADDLRFTVVAVGPSGAIEGEYSPDLMRSAQWTAPAAIRNTVAGCDEVAVLALPPWLGIGPVLDGQTPWHYVMGPPPPPSAGRTRRVVVAAPVTPPEAGLAPLAQRTWPTQGGPDEQVTGPAATPERVLAAISNATLIEIHSHATWLEALDAPVLALSAGANGWALGAARIRASRLTGAPIVILADCAGGAPARFEHKAWGLPLAFRDAGARAVIASLSAIPDRDATAFFDAVVAELARGSTPAVAVARTRAEMMRGDSTSWMRDVVVFQ